MADSALCGDVVKYFNRILKHHRNNSAIRAAEDSEELHEILALQCVGEPTRAPLIKLIAAQREFRGGQQRDVGLDYDALHSAPRAVIPLLVAYELDRRGILAEPRVAWGHWLNQLHAMTGMVAQPHE